MGKLEAFTREYSKEEKYRKLEIIITDQLEDRRREFKEQRKTHFSVH